MTPTLYLNRLLPLRLLQIAETTSKIKIIKKITPDTAPVTGQKRLYKIINTGFLFVKIFLYKSIARITTSRYITTIIKIKNIIPFIK